MCDGRRGGGALGTDRKVCSDAKRCHRGQALRHTTRRGGGSLGQHTTKTISLDSRPGKITTRANLNYNKIIPPIDIRCNFAPQYPALPQRGNFYRPNGILQISFFLLCNFVVAIVGLRVEESRLYSSQYTPGYYAIMSQFGGTTKPITPAAGSRRSAAAGPSRKSAGRDGGTDAAPPPGRRPSCVLGGGGRRPDGGAGGDAAPLAG